MTPGGLVAVECGCDEQARVPADVRPAGLGLLLGDRVWARFADLPAERLAEDEAFWAAIRAKYRLKPDYINLESGYYSMQATPVLEAFIAKVREINYQASYYLRTTQVPDKAAVRDKLAALARLRAGRALHHPQHHRVDRHRRHRLRLEARRRSRHGRAGLRPHARAVPAHGASLRHGQQARERASGSAHRRRDRELYANAITPRTRLLMVSHMVNITGQILPVRKIADMAHARGVDVLVDGAHAFAHFDFRIPDLGVDYYAASLHKWLGCPLGTGILYVRRDKIPGLWPIYGDWRMTDDADIMKLNHTGTHPVHTDLAIEHAIAFHETIGIQRKEARLRYLQTVLDQQGPRAAERDHEHAVGSGAHLRDRQCRHQGRGAGRSREDAARQVQDLDERDRQRRRGVHGVRVTPHVFILPRELDVLVKAISEIARA